MAPLAVDVRNALCSSCEGALSTNVQIGLHSFQFVPTDERGFCPHDWVGDGVPADFPATAKTRVPSNKNVRLRCFL